MGRPASSTPSSISVAKSWISIVASSLPTSSSTPTVLVSSSWSSSASSLAPSSSSSSNAVSPTANPPSSRSDTSATSQGLSVGARAGIGVGAVAIALLLALVTLSVWKLKKRRLEQAATAELPYSPIHEKHMDPKYHPLMPPIELYAGNAAVELGCRDPSELGRAPAQGERPYGRDDPKVVLQP
jgi:hypothetical protein